jgi:hypothetical protein
MEEGIILVEEDINPMEVDTNPMEEGIILVEEDINPKEVDTNPKGIDLILEDMLVVASVPKETAKEEAVNSSYRSVIGGIADFVERGLLEDKGCWKWLARASDQAPSRGSPPL